ncbi:Flp pilus assembly protein CpaB [Litorimonas sp. RW-G-Af-16]|uniref:Flp pilus assembly protein CpaB n=1 Tax=Litorimonas sp. RW-G-Af-16 TaxID=3241168 RepID=UPI00390C8CB4
MRLNTLVTLGASAAFGIMAVILARGWINGAMEDQFRQVQPVNDFTASVPAFPTQPVLVADMDLVFGDEITADILRIVDMPENVVPVGAFDEISDIFDPNDMKPVLALGEIRTNEVIMGHKISGQGGRSSLSARITPGYRAVAIRVDDVSGVAGFIVPGDLVDILYTSEPNPDAIIPTFRTDTLFQSVKVLGIDQNLSDQSSSPDVARTVTVEVAHMDAQALAVAMEGGTLSLSLRAVGETNMSASQATISTHLGRGAPKKRKTVARRSIPKAPALQATDPRTDIIVFRGDDKTAVTVLSEELQAGSAQNLSSTELAGG